MGSGFLKKKKQAKMFREQLGQMQDNLTSKLENIEVMGAAGAGLVELTLNGKNEMKRLSIKPECVDPEDIEGLETLIKAAYADALNKLQEQTESNASLDGMMPSFF